MRDVNVGWQIGVGAEPLNGIADVRKNAIVQVVGSAAHCHYEIEVVGDNKNADLRLVR
jgi:hypothetical protein